MKQMFKYSILRNIIRNIVILIYVIDAVYISILKLCYQNSEEETVSFSFNRVIIDINQTGFQD